MAKKKTSTAVVSSELVRRQRQYWIKARYNPQLGTYYVACGQMSKTAAKMHERPMYGDNVMHGYATESEYQARLTELRKTESVQ